MTESYEDVQATQRERPSLEAEETVDVLVDDHDGCTWEQVGPCVYCTTHNVRLYQGTLPAERRTKPPCLEHRWDDGDSMCQAGFYLLCLDCGAQEWTE